MNYLRSTFYDKHTPLTRDQIEQKLVGAAPGGGMDTAGFVNNKMKIILDDEGTLEYTLQPDKLTLIEDGVDPIDAPYAVKSLDNITLLTHMIPGSIRGFNIIIDESTNIVTVFETWFCGFEDDKREVWRDIRHGYIERGQTQSEKRHELTNRIEGLGLYWENDDAVRELTFFPSIIWSSFIELSNPRGGITKTAPSDFYKISDHLFIYSRVDCEYSGGFTLEIIDLFKVRHIGVKLGFDLDDALEYRMYSGAGEITGRHATLESLIDYGTSLPDDPMLTRITNPRRGERPVYRPQRTHKNHTQEELDVILARGCTPFEGESVMSSFNTMEATSYMNGKKFTLRYDDDCVWEYEIIDEHHLRWSVDGSAWQEETYEGYEPAPDIVIFSHICTGSRPFRCPTHAVDFSTALTTCVDAQIGNIRTTWEVGHRAVFGVLEIDGGPTPPAVTRHGFTTELLGKAFSWTYSDFMQSIHVYSSPDSYSWTIMLGNNAGGFMWSSPCLYVKLRDDAYLMSWTEDTCNGAQGTLVLNPRIMHDGGFFFGVSETEEPFIQLTPMGAYSRPLGGFDLAKYFIGDKII